MDKKIKGEEIMIFIPDDNSGMTSIAYATNHVLTITANVDDNSLNKDENPEWSASEITTRSWSISSDNIYCGSNYDKLFDLMISGTPVNIVFGHKKENYKSLADGNLDNWTPADSNVNGSLYEGKAVITSLTWNNEAGTNSTLTSEFTGIGSLKKKQ